jgi:hypothetical protein
MVAGTGKEQPAKTGTASSSLRANDIELIGTLTSAPMAQLLRVSLSVIGATIGHVSDRIIFSAEPN